MKMLNRARLLSIAFAWFVTLLGGHCGRAMAADAVGDTIQEARRLNEGGEQAAASRLMQAAIQSWQAKTHDEPKNAHAFYQLARLLTEFSSDKDALAAIDQALRLDNKQAEYHYLRYRLASYGNRPEEAFASLRKAVELAPQNIDYGNRFANLLLDTGDDERAVGILRNILKRDPKSTRTAILLAIALRRLQRYDDAIEVLKPVLAREPQNANAHSILAIVDETKGDLAGARDEFAAALKLQPENEGVLAKLVMLSEKLKRLADRDMFRAALVELHRRGKTTSPAFIRDEFEVPGQYRVVACENYELTAPNAVRYYFDVADWHKPTSFRISLGSYDFTTTIAREGGVIGPKERIFHLDLYRGPEHETYGLFRTEPTYEQTRAMVIEVLTGKRKPQSASVRPSKPGGPVQLTLPDQPKSKGKD